MKALTLSVCFYSVFYVVWSQYSINIALLQPFNTKPRGTESATRSGALHSICGTHMMEEGIKIFSCDFPFAHICNIHSNSKQTNNWNYKTNIDSLLLFEICGDLQYYYDNHDVPSLVFPTSASGEHFCVLLGDFTLSYFILKCSVILQCIKHHPWSMWLCFLN